jgi:acetyl esterase/lipase
MCIFVLSVGILASSCTQTDDHSGVITDVVYGHKDGMALTFDVFEPESRANGAGILYMVSGGWVSWWTPPERTRIGFEHLLDTGFTVFAVRHGSSPRYKVPDAVEDVRRAVRYIRLHSDEFGIDPERLGVYGGSAGGHLSLMLGVASDEGDAEAEDDLMRVSNRIAAVVAYYPPVDLRGITGPNERFPALEFDQQLAAGISPILHVTPDDPPSLMIHGDEDDLVPLRSSQVIYKAFQEHGVEADMIILEGAGHGFRGEQLQQARRATVAWFERFLLENR